MDDKQQSPTFEQQLSPSRPEQEAVSQEPTETSSSSQQHTEQQTSAQDASTTTTTRDPEQQRRGRRMFQMLVGTLNSAKNETSKKTEAALRRQTIEQRLAEKLQREKQELAARIEQERIATIAKREHSEKELENIKSMFVEMHRKNLANFIPTRTTPIIYFLPAKHNASTRRALESAQASTA